MTGILQIGDRVISDRELISLIGRYQLMPHLMRGLVVDDAIKDYDCMPEERDEFLKQFYERNKLLTPEAQKDWLQTQGIEVDQLESIVTRPVKLEKFKESKWGPKVESYFMTRKQALDRVLYSLIRTKDLGLAQELYFRIKEGEQTFSDLARQYSQGGEANTGGLVGPAPLTTPHPAIAKTLAVSQPGQLWPPTRLEDWYVIIRLEKYYPAQMDAAIRKQLINEMFEAWVRDQIKAIGAVKSLLEDNASQ
ncbi:hypothetical protein Pse7367_0513 [Thalassoporum mexicanum PCC 7367]|uniref:peptidylprolyl isomerase n=1 Tax=Thalassoporum mexicanum TaxID=3457544 RepID=UPI00029FAFA4|nr:peptidylprolyl isomerase [Pseudanabaena sp. PCC 7367]AFY68821.1 hypothetical protein Pse7367_0513 [Pseudanabaena sp. PCC 7367]